MHFTTKNLLVIVTSIALVIAGLAFLSRSLAPDPNSELFTILDAHSTPDWKPCAKKKLNSTVVATWLPIQPLDGYRGTVDVELSFNQPLFTYKYTDFFGNETYHIDYVLSVDRNADWTDYLVHPLISGGGNVGASAEITTRFDIDSRTLIVTVHQQFANLQEAKCVNLEFRWDGKRFVQANDAELNVAHEAAELTTLVVRKSLSF